MNTSKKVALVTGCTGQTGSYLCDLLLEKGYIVHGIKRRSSSINTERINHILQDENFTLHYGDLSDANNINTIIKNVRPDEIYNLGAMSHVKVSFDIPEYTADIDAIGPLRILESVRLLGLKETKIYQASTSELYGLVKEVPQNEKTPFHPRSPYGVAKLYAYWIMINYRESYNMFTCNGILFNHESIRREETFVSRKITLSVANIFLGRENKLWLGNLNAKRDWGHAKDYCKAIWLMMQQDIPDDYVISTGITTEIRDFVKICFEEVGIEIEFIGSGLNEVGLIKSMREHIPHLHIGQEVVGVDSKYYRPSEVDILLGDSTKAKNNLGWVPEYDLKSIIKEMIDHDLKILTKK